MKLPNAPLVEVVFELRWALEGQDDVPVQIRHDPAFHLLAYEFSENAKARGWGVRREMAKSPTGPLGHSIQYRYYRDENSSFPILQIGPGIFAYNESTNYEWSSYRNSLREAARVLLSSYPKSKALKIKPVHLELRYVNSFGNKLLGHNDLLQFLKNDTKLALEPNTFLKSDALIGAFEGVISMRRQLSKDTMSTFIVDIGTGKSSNSPSIVVNSKVVKKSTHVDLGNNSRSIIANLIQWIDVAHEVTHAFFLDFVSEALMQEFLRKG